MSNFVPEKTALGIEFGSTRIKAVLIGPEHTPLAQGDYTWENQLHNGIWTYPLEQVWQGLQSAYAALAATSPSAKMANCWCRSAPGATPSPAQRPRS